MNAVATPQDDAEQPLFRLGDVSVPWPAALVAVDTNQQTINLSIVVVGSGVDEFLDHIHRTTADAETDAQQVIEASVRGEASFSYLCLRLGYIRGLGTQIHLYGFRSDERLVSKLGDFVAHVGGIIVVQKTNDEPVNDVVHAVARGMTEAGRTIPVAMLAPEVVKVDWERHTGARLVFAKTMAEDAMLPAVKAVAKEMLASLTVPGNASGEPGHSSGWLTRVRAAVMRLMRS